MKAKRLSNEGELIINDTKGTQNRSALFTKNFGDLCNLLFAREDESSRKEMTDKGELYTLTKMTTF